MDGDESGLELEMVGNATRGFISRKSEKSLVVMVLPKLSRSVSDEALSH